MIRYKKRLIGLGIVISIAFTMLTAVIGYIKVVLGDEYEKQALLQLLNANNTEMTIQPGRGSILDRNNQPMAISENVYDVILDVKVLHQKEEAEQEKIFATIGSLLEMDLEKLRGIAGVPANQENNYFILQKEVSADTAVKIRDMQKQIEEFNLTKKKGQENPNSLSCVYLIGDVKRKYIVENAAPQVIGFKRGETYFGLESSYNDTLSGEPGRIFRVFESANNPITEEVPAIQGNTLVTTLDTRIQNFAKQALDSAAEIYLPRYASVVVMNPNTGEVLAMAQYPTFNPNAPADAEYFTDEDLKQTFDDLSEDEQVKKLNQLWNNFSTLNLFEPGSIFKPIVAAAALEENVITSDEMFICGGDVAVSGTLIPCWIKATGGTHGTQTLRQSLAYSCNVSIINIIQKLGRDSFFAYRNDFGFGEKTGIDLPAEQSGSSTSVMYALDALNPVELATSSMGQGFACTALQAVSAMSAVINGGHLMKPYVVSRILEPNGALVSENKPEIVRKVISAETSEWMRTALEQVASPTGTGKALMIDGYRLGGKTGTAQQGPRDNDELTVSCIAYLPVENPQYIALAVIDHPQNETDGAASAAPMLNSVFTNIIAYKSLPSSY